MKHAAISAMEKLLLGCLLCLSACQTATPTPLATLPPTATFSPTLVPVTVTPQPTATPEITATPLPRFFTDEFDISLTGWTILQAGSDAAPNIRNENSNLIFEMSSPYTWAYALYDAQSYADVRIDAQFINQAGSPASIGLICRYSESEGWFEYNILTDGTYSVLHGHWLANGIADYLPIASGSSGAIQPSGAVQEIGLVCSETTLSLLIGQGVLRRIDVSRYALTEGKFGITVSSFENSPVVAAFNWVRVSEP